MRGNTHWKWHLDEVYVKINGEMYYLWRAVDHEGEVLESYVTKTRDRAAKRHLTKSGFTPEDYCLRFGLPSDYPLVAADYTAVRSALAKSNGLGRTAKRS